MVANGDRWRAFIKSPEAAGTSPSSAEQRSDGQNLSRQINAPGKPEEIAPIYVQNRVAVVLPKLGLLGVDNESIPVWREEKAEKKMCFVWCLMLIAMETVKYGSGIGAMLHCMDLTVQGDHQ